MKTPYTKVLEKKAKEELKTNIDLVEAVKDIQNHFKTEDKAWKLSFAFYYGASKVKALDVFTTVLRLKKFKVKYDKDRGILISK